MATKKQRRRREKLQRHEYEYVRRGRGGRGDRRRISPHWVTGGSLSTTAKLFNIVLLLVIFLPFSYLVDAMIYRAVQRRQRKDAGG